MRYGALSILIHKHVVNRLGVEMTTEASQLQHLRTLPRSTPWPESSGLNELHPEVLRDVTRLTQSRPAAVREHS